MALVLTRRLGETVTVGPDVRVRIISITKGVVKLAIDAPRDVRIDRLEVVQRKEKETA